MMIPVTKPFLPPIEEYNSYVKDIWTRNWLTNNGPLVNELEIKIKEYLGIEHLLYVTNGTIALQLAIKALGLKGEVITTPFSYVATASSIVWEGCTPVFVDIDPETLNIDPAKIEAAITSLTTGIVATHVYGNPCNVEAIDDIAKKHNLKVIYDGAHAFGTKYKGKSIFTYGDVTTASFHATKLFHTIEGGAVVTKDAEVLNRMSYMRNFGHDGYENFNGVGINGKNSEFHAAMGLANLKHLDLILQYRKNQSLRYDNSLDYRMVKKILIEPEAEFNYAYYPVIFENESTTLKVKVALEFNQIFPRRYFYPSLNSIPIYSNKSLPVCEEISKCVLCLPMYHTLTNDEIDFVCRTILRAHNS